MKKPLSPAAEKVWNAFNDVYERTGTFEDFGDALAAAFRTFADAPLPPLFNEYTGCSYDEGMADGYDEMRRRLRIVANELES